MNQEFEKGKMEVRHRKMKGVPLLGKMISIKIGNRHETCNKQKIEGVNKDVSKDILHSRDDFVQRSRTSGQQGFPT